MSPVTTTKQRSLELTDYLLRLEGGLDLDLGAALIDEFADADALAPSLVGDRQLDHEVRRSNQVNLAREARQRGTAAARSTSRRLKNSIHDWMSAYCNHIEAVQLDTYAAPALIRYDVGDFFTAHCDANKLSLRTVSAVALLPSHFDGGDLTFFDGRQSAELSPGDVVLFPSNFLFPHAVSPVTDGVRYSIVTWMH